MQFRECLDSIRVVKLIFRWLVRVLVVGTVVILAVRGSPKCLEESICHCCVKLSSGRAKLGRRYLQAKVKNPPSCCQSHKMGRFRLTATSMFQRRPKCSLPGEAIEDSEQGRTSPRSLVDGIDP